MIKLELTMLICYEPVDPSSSTSCDQIHIPSMTKKSSAVAIPVEIVSMTSSIEHFQIPFGTDSIRNEVQVSRSVSRLYLVSIL